MKTLKEALISKDKRDWAEKVVKKSYGIIQDKDIIITNHLRYIVLFDKKDILQATPYMERQDVFKGGMLYRNKDSFNLVTYYDPNTLKNIYSGVGDIEYVYRCKDNKILKEPIDDILADFDKFKNHWKIIWKR